VKDKQENTKSEQNQAKTRSVEEPGNAKVQLQSRKQKKRRKHKLKGPIMQTLEVVFNQDKRQGLKVQFVQSYTTRAKTAKVSKLYAQGWGMVLVIKPHNKTPYELFLGRKPALSFIRPFGCPVTILNTLDHLGNQTNGNAGTKANIDAGQAGKKTVPGPQYVLLPLLTSDSQGSKSLENKVADNAGMKSTEVLRKENGVQDPAKEGRERVQRNEFESMFRQDKDANGNRMFTPISAVGSTYLNLGGSIPVNDATLPNVDLPIDSLMPDLKDTADL
nr:retrovirus-related Pol polyprotein from transposon TNT 1-94 [Tanacetum cinerariifolium]